MNLKVFQNLTHSNRMNRFYFRIYHVDSQFDRNQSLRDILHSVLSAKRNKLDHRFRGNCH